MDEGRRRDIGLFRYALICGCADAALSKAERGALVRALAACEHVGPGGRLVTVGRTTLDDWIRAWRSGGFEALLPAERVVAPRTAPEVLELAEAVKRELPARTAAQVHAVMIAAGQDGVPTVRTLQRHFARVGLNKRPDGMAPRAFGRFEASARNELWTGDGLHGPIVAGRRAVLLAFIDDYSRMLVGWRWGTGEHVLGLEAALRPGLLARGVPDAILVDRGSAFVSSQLHRACAVLGIRLIHAAPRAATTKGKIERFFRTVRDQFLVELGSRAVADLAELNGLFSAWVEVVYHQRVHTETRARPLERFELGAPPALPAPGLLREAFLWSELRTVTKTATVSLHGNGYEVDAALIGQRCDLLFDPFDLTRIEVRYQGRAMGLAVAVKVGRHVHPQVRSEPPPPPAGTGIDYLGLICSRRDAELAGRPIDYAAMTDDEQAAITDADTDDGSRT